MTSPGSTHRDEVGSSITWEGAAGPSSSPSCLSRRRWPIPLLVSGCPPLPDLDHTRGHLVDLPRRSLGRMGEYRGCLRERFAVGDLSPASRFLLAPIAMISNGLGLTESLAPVFLDHPTAWLVLGPAIALLGSTCLFGLDAMAEYVGVGKRRRMVLCWMEGVVLFQVLAIWGHPEDVVALALALYALMATFEALVAVRTSVGGGDRRPASRHPSVSDGVCARSPWESCHGDPGRRPSIRTPSECPGRYPVATDLEGPPSSGQFPVSRPCNPLDRAVTSSDTDQCGCRTWSDDRRWLRSLSGPVRRQTSTDRCWTALVVRCCSQPAMLLRVRHGALLSRSPVGPDRPGVRAREPAGYG